MKAIANVMYYDHSKTYEAVAVVNRRACEKNEKISLMDFKSHKSCHGEVEGFDICSACNKENETCPEKGLYSDHSGAFRCLVEELGDIAFVKGDTVLLYSMEGPHSQLWSTKSVRDFMCVSLSSRGLYRKSMAILEIVRKFLKLRFGAVPANVKMAHYSMPNKKREHILETLTNSSLLDALYAPNNVLIHLFSPSTQGLTMIEKVTRLYLRKSASISQSILKLNAPETRVASYEADNSSDESSSSSYICCSQVMTMLTPDVTADTWNHSKIEETWYYSIKLLKVLFCLMWEVLAKKLNMMSY
ncbi:hypothetical protein JHK86_028930 [Glycine max]|nr:hypothetical protein JHK86_028930 [Glycine max]